MKEATPSLLIDVRKLRVGMFVHLDGGWMSHPFPLSSFKISSPEQIQTILGLGRPRVRWSPERSDILPEVDRPASTVPAPLENLEANPAGLAASPSRPEAAAEVESAEETEKRQHREALAGERRALQVCENQFAEATGACRSAMSEVLRDPAEAKRQSEALARALVTKLAGKEEMCIRLLTDAAGDSASLHSVNVAVISMLMGRTFGLSDEEMHDIAVGALLHDMGKLELPERIRHRDENFSQVERDLYQEHVARGVALARKMNLRPGAIQLIAQHHEHADGSGFPLKLTSERMTTAARIVSLINRYDNMCNPHVPSRGLTPHEALAQLFAQGKSRYDTAILGAFIRMMGVYPPGSTVQLTDDRYAMVVSVNSSRPLKPKVLVHDANVPRDEALLLDLGADGRLGIRRSLKPQQLPHESIQYLSPRTRIAYYFEPNSGLLES